MQSRYTKFLIILALLSITLFLYYAFAQSMTLENLHQSKAVLKAYVDQHYVRAVVLFMALYFFAVIALLPIVLVLSIASGFLFGIIPGVLYVIVSATAGATLVFLAVRFLFVTAVFERNRKHFVLLKKLVEKYDIYALIVVRFIPIIPFFLINVLTPFLGISAKKFIITTVLGIVPSTLLYVTAGAQLEQITKVSDIFTPQLLTLAIILAILVILSVIIQKNSSSLLQKLNS